MSRPSLISLVTATLIYPVQAFAFPAFDSITKIEPSFVTDDMAQKIFGSEDDLTNSESGEEKEKLKQGWEVKLNLGANLSLSYNDSWIGNENGTIVFLGAQVGGSANLRAGQQYWENSVAFQQTFQGAFGMENFPDRFIKTLDQLDVISTYTFRLLDPAWFGFFGRARLNTQVFNGYIVTPEDAQVRDVTGVGGDESDLTATDGAAIALLEAGDSFDLTSPFEPMNLRQTLGLFLEPYTAKEFTLSFRVGLGAQEIITQSGYINTSADDIPYNEEDPNDDPDRPERIIFVRNLKNDDGRNLAVEIGIETEMDFRGEIIPERLSYYSTINTFVAPYNSAVESNPESEDRDFLDTVNIRIDAGISLKLAKYITVDYGLTLLRIPAIQETVQLQNNLFINANFDVL